MTVEHPRRWSMHLRQPIWKLGAVGIALSSLGGCTPGPFVKHSPGTTYGEILVSPPRVASRQRLVEDRLEQDKWLRGQLNKDIDVSTTQGKADLRSAMSLVLGAQVNVDPIQTPVFAAQQKKAADDATRANELESLKFKLEQKRLKAALDQAEKETDPSKITSPYSDSGTATTPAAGTSTKPAADLSKLMDTMDKISAQVDALNKRGTLTPTPMDSSAKSSAVDEFRDRLAYREEVRNELILNALDDRHDVQGNALYRLSFDATVLPQNDTSAWAVIGVCLQRKGGKRCDGGRGTSSEDQDNGFSDGDMKTLQRELSKDWQRKIGNNIREIRKACASSSESDCIDKLPRSIRKAVLDGYSAIVASSAVPEGNSTPSTSTENRLKPTKSRVLQIDYRLPTRSAYLLSAKRNSVSSSEKFDAKEVCTHIKDRAENDATYLLYKSSDQVSHSIKIEINKACQNQKESPKFRISELAEELALIGSTIQKIEGIRSPIDGFCASREDIYPRKDKNPCYDQPTSAPLINSLGDRGHIEIYAYAGTPKEQVQRISEVASRSQAIELALALQALRGNTGIESFLNYTKRNDAFFHALRRQPLVVGFGHSSAQQGPVSSESLGRADFGWVMGPRWAIRDDGKSGHFRHSVSQQGLSAVISVPSWWEDVELVVSRKWISEGGSVAVKTSGQETITYSVRLPADPSSILAVLRSEPQIEPEALPDDSPAWKLTSGKPGQIVIRGRDLWRNPLVMVGGQKANDVSVLPDMEGIIARFDTVDQIAGGPPPLDAPNGLVPVLLSTSEGSDIVGYAKIEDPAKATNAVAQLADIPTGVLFGGKLAKISLTQPLSGYHHLASVYRVSETRAQFKQLGDNLGWQNAKSLLFKVPQKMAVAGDKLELRLLLTERKGEEPSTIGFKTAVWYFENESQIRPHASFDTANGKCDVVLSKFPIVFKKIYQIKDDELKFDIRDVGNGVASNYIRGCRLNDKDLICKLNASSTEPAKDCPKQIELTLQGRPEGWPELVEGILSRTSSVERHLPAKKQRVSP